MATVVNSGLTITGKYSNTGLDTRYGPWSSVATAVKFLENDEEGEHRVYYGLTIGIKVLDDNDEVVGIDDYWWQPKCVWDGHDYVDGFVRKYPANTPIVQKDSQKVIGLSSQDHNYSAEWTEGGGNIEWQTLDAVAEVGE